jgi:hypothetical protein
MGLRKGAVKGPTANPAMVAAGSQCPSRSKSTARMAKVMQMVVVLPASR